VGAMLGKSFFMAAPRARVGRAGLSIVRPRHGAERQGRPLSRW
jgi:hypothetical protein